jgi:hypothetical protein
MGTDGFEFIEYAAPDPVAMGSVFERMGFVAIARHRHKNVTLYRQGGGSGSGSGQGCVHARHCTAQGLQFF